MENQTCTPASTPNPRKLVGQLVAAVILAEGIWGFVASLTTNLLVPLLARVMDAEPQSPLYLGKGELFTSGLQLCVAGILFVLLYEWSRRQPGQARVKMVRVVRKTSQPAPGTFSITASPEAVAVLTRTAPPASAQSVSSAPPVAPPPAQQQLKPTSPQAAAPAKPKSPKDVYYNIVGDPISPTEDD
jgi:hypothetical protein